MAWNIVPYGSVPESSTTTPKNADLEMSAKSAQSSISRVEELKMELKSLLAKNGGCTNEPDVLAVIDELASLNPCREGCARGKEFLGEFVALTCPTFPGRLKPEPGQEHVVQYKLGRLSFNIFQPHKLVCTMRSVRNHVTVNGKTEDGNTKFSYPLVLDITIHTPDGDLPAIVINEAHCYENPDVNNRLMVSFTGGTLLPAEEVRNDPSKLDLWAKTFEGAYQKANEERSYFGWFFQWILKLLLGLTYPTDDCLTKNSFHFEIKRAPIGYLDVLYLDDDLRITKGNRGTIVVVERPTKQ